MLLGPLITGEDSVTSFNIEWVPSILLIGQGSSAPDIKGLTITIGGETYQRLVFDEPYVLDTIAELNHKMALSAPFVFFVVADGFIPKQTVQIDIINNGAATPNVYAFSARKSDDGAINNWNTELVLQNQNKLFDNFDALVWEPANFSACDIEFADGHSESQLTADELDALLAQTMNIPSRTDDSATTVIDNTARNIRKIVLYANGSGNLTVAKQNF